MNRVPAIAYFVMLVSSILLPGCGGSAPQQSMPENLAPVSMGDGEQAISEGDFESAASIFAQLINDNPNDPVLHYYLGLSKDNLGETDAAVDEYKKALTLNPELTNARLNLGLVYFLQGNIDGAIAEFEAVLAVEPDAADVHYNLAMALAAAGKMKKAKSHYEKSASLDPEDPDPLVALGNLEKDAGNVNAALSLFEKAETIGAGSAIAVLSSAQILIEQNKTEAAVTKLLSVGEMEADAETLASAGLLLSKLDHADDAIAMYQQALHVNPGSTKAALLLGNALARSGKFAEAAEHFQQILDTAPDSPEAGPAQKGLAACKAKLGQ